MTFRYVDCQGFGGGLACGAALAGYQLTGKLEKTGGFGVPLVEAQRGGMLGDGWETQVGEPDTWDPVRADVVGGTPPCSAFSMMTVGYDAHGVDSRINDCMRDLFAYAARVRPAAVVMESVQGAFGQGLPLMRSLVETLNAETKLAYRATHILQNNLSLGGATQRKRYFLVASQVPFGVERYEFHGHPLPTLEDAIGDLRPQPLAWDAQPYAHPGDWYSRRMRVGSGEVDGHIAPTNRFAERVMDVAAGDKGVPWHDGELLSHVLQRYHETHGDLPASWAYPTRSRKYPELSHLTRDKQLAETGFQLGGFNQTRTWDWNAPGRVLTGAGPFMVWHPNGRFLTHREAARIMGFPDAWRIAPCRDDKRLFLYWGKGTSVHPATWVMRWLKASLEGNPGELRGDVLDEGDRLINVTHDWHRVTRESIAS